MLFKYKILLNNGQYQEGQMDSSSQDSVIAFLQSRGYVVSYVKPAEDSKSLFDIEISIFKKVSAKDVVILSRQLATLFNAQVSALRIFRIMAEQSENKELGKILFQISDDIQGGSTIAKALSKHPEVFSDFYVNMVLSGEESGKLNETFDYLADYLDRTYEVVSKAKNALVYPIFVIVTFIAVMVLMLTVIIPKIALMIKDSGQEVPIYTKAVIFASDFLRNHILLLGFIVVGVAVAIFRYIKTAEGARYFDELKLNVPYVGNLYRKLYLSRISDNLNTMILSGIPILRALEITSSVVDNNIYKEVLNTSLKDVKEGVSLSNSFSKSDKYIPGILVQMVKVGEESGELGSILKTLSKFYQREVVNAVDTLVGLIEPVMIVSLGLGVGLLLAAVLMPIYNIASTG